MELVLPMYNAHPYFFLTNLYKKVHIIYGKYGKKWSFSNQNTISLKDLLSDLKSNYGKLLNETHSANI